LSAIRLQGVVCPDAVLPVKIRGKACLTRLVSCSMVSFRQESEVYRDDWPTSGDVTGMAQKPNSYCCIRYC
ncbi:MAG: hypothetical protein KAT09_04430, partial [Candidatus Aegiribacteria sp.]|nr:hypothetical protein [Candidatus Aegiribacteria sp.]